MFDFSNQTIRFNMTPTALPGHSLWGALLDEIDIGVLLCDSLGRVLVANHAAHDELAGGGPVSIVDGQLRADDTPDLRAALRGAAVSGRRQLLRLGSNRARALLYLLPMAVETDGRHCVAVILGQRPKRSDLAFELLGQHFRLTDAERQILSALVAGKRAGAIARERGVAISTVRTQIMSLRTKTGTGGISALVGLVSEMPPMMTALRKGGAPSSRAVADRIGSELPLHHLARRAAVGDSLLAYAHD